MHGALPGRLRLTNQRMNEQRTCIIYVIMVLASHFSILY